VATVSVTVILRVHVFADYPAAEDFLLILLQLSKVLQYFLLLGLSLELQSKGQFWQDLELRNIASRVHLAVEAVGRT